MHERSGGTAGTQKIHNEIERLCVQNGRRLKIFSGGGRSRKHEDSRTNNRADAERCQRPRAECFTEPVFRILGLRNQFVDGLTTKGLGIRSTYDVGDWLRG